MEKPSESDSSEIIGDWDFTPPVNPEGITMISVPTSQESKDARSNPLETRVSTSIVAGEGKEEAARRVLPPWMEPSYEWGSGKWRKDGRKKKKNKEKESEEIIPFKEIIESLLRNSGEKSKEEEEEEEDEEKGKSQSVVEILKSMCFKFP